MLRLESLTSPESLEDREDREAPEHPEALEAPEYRERGVESRGFARGAFEALWITAIFVALGLGYAEVLKRAPARPAVYAPAFVATRSPDDPSVWLVDGFNVVQRTLLGGRERDEWWTARRRTQLLERAACFDDPAAEVWVVFDGPEGEPEGSDPRGLRQVFAPSADDWLVARVRAAEDPGQIAVVTSDRRLAGRARRRGARVVAPSEFLRRCSG
jgi:predicted RNA-binding protein with PIN domain